MGAGMAANWPAKGFELPGAYFFAQDFEPKDIASGGWLTARIADAMRAGGDETPSAAPGPASNGRTAGALSNRLPGETPKGVDRAMQDLTLEDWSPLALRNRPRRRSSGSSPRTKD